MNIELFQRHQTMLTDILAERTETIGLQETRYRKDNLQRTYNSMMLTKVIDDRYYALSHEIRAIDMFATMGAIQVSQDSKNQPGADLIYKNNLIECVISTAGNEENYIRLKKCGFQELSYHGDYNEKFNLIALRVLNSIAEKKKKHENHLKRYQELINSPYCIFINMGSLSQEWFPGEYFSDANRFLVGRGFIQIQIDSITGKQIGSSGYTYEPSIVNHNDAQINMNVFGDPDNSMISAIILCDADLSERYTSQNNVIFINPYAKNQLMVKDFRNFIYWRANHNNEYIPRRNGRRVR